MGFSASTVPVESLKLYFLYNKYTTLIIHVQNTFVDTSVSVRVLFVWGYRCTRRKPTCVTAHLGIKLGSQW